MSGTTIPSRVIQRANFVLDRDDILDLSNTIHTLKDNLSTVQNTITKVQKVLDVQVDAVTLTQRSLEDAKANEKCIIETISRGEALLAPSAIRILPAEILSQIFLRYLDLCFPNHDRLQYTTILQAQNFLLQICRRWRQTMMSDPRLWRTIPVGFFGGNRHFERPNGEYWEMLKERISRAACTQNLRVALVIHVGDSTSQSRLLQTALELLSRATTFQIEAYYRLEDEETLPRPVETINNLKEIVLCNMDTSYGSWISSLLACASNLQSLQCHTMSPKFLPSSCLGRLLCLRLDNLVSIDDIVRVLADAPLLSELYIHRIRRTGVLAPSPSRHVRLETLHVYNANFDFLEYFTLPGLRHLSFERALEYTANEWTSRLSTSIAQWPSNSGASTRFFERSKCKLLSLEVTDVRLSPELVDILQSQECLETLYFECRSKNLKVSVHSTILDFLEANLPSLTKLRVCVEPDQIPAIQQMLAERNKRDNFVALESCYVVVLTGGYTDEKMEESHRRIFGEFLEGSMGLRLTYH